MSAMKRKEAEHLLARALADEDALDRMDQLLAEIDSAAAQGYAYCENTPFLGGATLGVLLPRLVNGGQVVLGCGGVIERMRPQRENHLEVIRSIFGIPME